MTGNTRGRRRKQRRVDDLATSPLTAVVEEGVRTIHSCQPKHANGSTRTIVVPVEMKPVRSLIQAHAISFQIGLGKSIDVRSQNDDKHM